MGRISGPEWRHYSDPATELEVIRLTDSAFASGMTAPHLRQFGRRSETMLYWSDRNGARQAYYLDLKSGDSRQLTDAAALDPLSLTLSADERSVFFFDGPAINETALSGLRSHTLYRVADGASRTGITVAFDGSVLFAEGLRIVRVSRQHASEVLRADADVSLVLARPRLAQFVYRTGDAIWLANLDGTGRRRLQLEPGGTSQILWTPLGRTLIYLHVPDDSKQLISLREHSPDDDSDRLIARTSQFATVSSNGDSSVFAGASRSRASAYVLLLLRVTRRELTLCEHHASDPAMVSPVFSPDSQSVFFVSDRHGKSAIYRVHVEKFVEETGADDR